MNRHLTAGSHEAIGRKQADCTSDAELAQPALFSECVDGRPLNRAAKALLVLAATSAGTAAAVPPSLPAGGIPSREMALGLVRCVRRLYRRPCTVSVCTRDQAFHSGAPR